MKKNAFLDTNIVKDGLGRKGLLFGKIIEALDSQNYIKYITWHTLFELFNQSIGENNIINKKKINELGMFLKKNNILLDKSEIFKDTRNYYKNLCYISKTQINNFYNVLRKTIIELWVPKFIELEYAINVIYMQLIIKETNFKPILHLNKLLESNNYNGEAYNFYAEKMEYCYRDNKKKFFEFLKEHYLINIAFINSCIKYYSNDKFNITEQNYNDELIALGDKKYTDILKGLYENQIKITYVENEIKIVGKFTNTINIKNDVGFPYLKYHIRLLINSINQLLNCGTSIKINDLIDTYIAYRAFLYKNSIICTSDKKFFSKIGSVVKEDQNPIAEHVGIIENSLNFYNTIIKPFLKFSY